jgi:copper(I)-binding protein
VTRSRRAVTPTGRLAIAAAIAGLAIGVSACEAGNNAPTLEFHPQSAGLDVMVRGIKITDAFVLGWASGPIPAGQSASVFLALYNEGRTAERLTGASAPGVAKSVTVPAGGVALPSSESVRLTGPKPEIVLSGLLHPLQSGGSVKVTLTFSGAGNVSVTLPVLPRTEDYSTFSPAPPPATPTTSASPGKHSPTATPGAGSSTAPATSSSPTPTS